MSLRSLLHVLVVVAVLVSAGMNPSEAADDPQRLKAECEEGAATACNFLGVLYLKGAVLQKFRYRHIEVTAHTDTKPIRNDPRKLFRDNLELSRARVEQASQALINSGVDADRVKAVVYTTAKSLDNDESRNRNRRIEIVVSSSLAAHSPQAKQQPGKKPPQSISLSSPRRP